MIVTEEVFGEIMVIIDMVDNQYTARGVHKGEWGEEDKQLHLLIIQVYLFFVKLPSFTSH